MRNHSVAKNENPYKNSETGEDRMLAAQTQETIDQARKDGYTQAQAAERTVGRAQGLTVAQYTITLMQIQAWIEVKAAQPWKAEGLRWEEWAPIHLGYSDTYIDHAIRDVHKIGPQNYDMLQQIGATRAQIMAMRRGIDSGDVQIDDTTISIGRITFDLVKDRERAQAYLSEMKAALDAKDKEGKRKDETLAQHQQLARERDARYLEQLKAKDAQIRALSQLDPPADLASDVDRESWRAARQALGECDLRVSGMAALAADPTRTDVLRARVMGHLRMLHGWIEAAMGEIAEQMPPEWADIIEAEQADCAVAPALSREMIDEVKERVKAKGGLMLVAGTGASNGHDTTSIPLPA